MAYLLASIPYFRCLVRKEYVRDFRDGEGEYLEATAVAVLCVRGDSLQFQVVLHEPLAGCAFTLPIEALATRPCPHTTARIVQPWDVFSSDFGVCEIATVRRGAVELIRDKVKAEYRFTLAFTGTDVADDPAQRKLLHVVLREDGLVAAYPNNRLVFLDTALFGELKEKPQFETLSREFRAEGLQRHHESEETDGPAGGILPSLREGEGQAGSGLRSVSRGLQIQDGGRCRGVERQEAAASDSDQTPNCGA